MSNGRVPLQFTYYNRPRGDSSVYIYISELISWAYGITAATSSGELYHDSAEILEDAFKAIASFFDGSKGTYRDIMTGETKSYPEICEWTDIRDYFANEFSTKIISWPLYMRVYEYEEDNNQRWYNCLLTWTKRVERFCKFNDIRYTKLIQTMMIQYNPIADYWTKVKEVGANSPYVSINNNKTSQAGPAEEMTIDDWNQDTSHGDGYKSETTSQANPSVKTEHFTTTYDDSSAARLESYDLQTGGTKNTTTNGMPNSGYFKKREEEGNKGTISPQDAIIKEFDIAQLWDIVELFLNDLGKEVFLSVWET